MYRSSPAVILGLALLAGVLAGFLVASFHFFTTEPLLQRAIDLEAAHRQAAGQPLAPELFTRSTQRAGLFLGYLLYGVGWGLLFGVICSLVFLGTNQSREPRSAWRQLLWLVVICYWTVGLFPQLKYPANPPGVGSPATITYRQELYLGCLVLSVESGDVFSLALCWRDSPVLVRTWGNLPSPMARGVEFLLEADPSGKEPDFSGITCHFCNHLFLKLTVLAPHDLKI